MARWDIAEWVGPTDNKTKGGMVETRGLVIHIMQGTYAGSIAWGKNPASSVSFHFATRGDGHLGQLVDTADAAWTQGNGNGHWISVENEGYSGNPLTAGQVEGVAQVYARGVREYGWPMQTTDDPNGRGLGWHGMGGQAWGGHFDCPGEPIKAQRGAILARAQQILTGAEEDDMALTAIQTSDVNGDTVFLHPWEGKFRRVVKSSNPWILKNVLQAYAFAGIAINAYNWPGPYDFSDPAIWTWAGFEIKPEGAVTFSPADLAKVADAAKAGAEAGAAEAVDGATIHIAGK